MQHNHNRFLMEEIVTCLEKEGILPSSLREDAIDLLVKKFLFNWFYTIDGTDIIDALYEINLDKIKASNYKFEIEEHDDLCLEKLPINFILDVWDELYLIYATPPSFEDYCSLCVHVVTVVLNKR